MKAKVEEKAKEEAVAAEAEKNEMEREGGL